MPWNNMTEAEKLGENIRYLRELFGESQEKLGFVLGVTKEAISNYENGRYPPKDKLSKIADHYMVTIDSLVHSDYSWLAALGTFECNFLDLCECIPAIFPLIYVGRAMDNDHYRRAFSKHKEFYNQIRKGNLNGVGILDSCIDEYFTALEDETIKNEVSVNLLALFFFLLVCEKNAINFKPNSALVYVLSKTNNIVKEIFDSEQNMKTEEKHFEAEKISEDSELMMVIFDIIRSFKHDPEWSDLADYYLALQFVYNLVDNDRSAILNSTIGIEMMGALVSVGNNYADVYIKTYYATVRPSKSPRFIDDK